MEKNRTNGKNVSKQERTICELNQRVSMLEKSKSDIDLLSKDSHKYKFTRVREDGNHSIKRGDDGIIMIETSGDGFSIHEIAHVRQSLKAGGLEFDASGYLKNAGTRVKGDTEKIQALVDAEVEAYQMQYSYSPKSMPKPVRRISEINMDYVGSILNSDGKEVYPFIKLFKYRLKK